MYVTRVIEADNNVLFTVGYQGNEFRAVQLLDRNGDRLYANTKIEVGDLVLVVEVPGFLFGPNMPESDASEAVSHIIVGLVPPSNWHEIQDYSNLVKRHD